RNRGFYVLKSRGMAHSNQVREFVITSRGIELLDIFVGPEGVLIGSARLAHQERERAAAFARAQDVGRRRQEIASRQRALEAQITALRGELAADEAEILRLLAAEQEQHELATRQRHELTSSRQGKPAPSPAGEPSAGKGT
ncbi:MAG TPA: KaiC 1, partial [Thermoanaerobaculia bacterium]